MSNRSKLLKTASLKISEQDATIKEKTKEAEALKKEIQTLIENNEAKSSEITEYQKEAAARKLVKNMVSKGYVSPADAENKIASFIASSDNVGDIEKMAGMVVGFQEKVINDGELMEEKVATERSAESVFLSELNK